MAKAFVLQTAVIFKNVFAIPISLKLAINLIMVLEHRATANMPHASVMTIKPARKTDTQKLPAPAGMRLNLPVLIIPNIKNVKNLLVTVIMIAVELGNIVQEQYVLATHQNVPFLVLEIISLTSVILSLHAPQPEAFTETGIVQNPVVLQAIHPETLHLPIMIIPEVRFQNARIPAVMPMPIAVHMAAVIAMMVTEETGQPIVILIPVMA